MTDERLADELVTRVLGWRLGPGRYIKPGRSWIPRSKFRPLTDLRDAFRLLDSVTNDYSLIATREGKFTVEVRHDGRVGKASGEPKAKSISVAIAQVLGIDTEAKG